ncbi:MAG: hypothetical protein K2O36_03730 [Ruminococcus sp.]|nr:hypothetical protein [Ruminococcus sp.]
MIKIEIDLSEKGERKCSMLLNGSFQDLLTEMMFAVNAQYTQIKKQNAELGIMAKELWENAIKSGFLFVDLDGKQCQRDPSSPFTKEWAQEILKKGKDSE